MHLSKEINVIRSENNKMPPNLLMTIWNYFRKKINEEILFRK